jgi:hypothetical protein
MAERFEPRSVARLTVALLLLVLISWAWSYLPANLHRESYNGRLYLLFSEAPIAELRSYSPTFPGFAAMTSQLSANAPRSARWHALGFTLYMGEWLPLLPDGSHGGLPLPYIALMVPYWSLASLAGLLTLIALLRVLRRKRAEFHGHCLSCGYDLRFSRDRCPECGSLIPEEARSREAAA